MLITKKCTFHYDDKEPAFAGGHVRYKEHDGKPCIAFFSRNEHLGPLDIVRVEFEDGFTANVYNYELEEIK